MKALGLRSRFLVAGLLLVATSAGPCAWSAAAFRRVSEVVDATVRDSEETTAATGTLASDLEREDDALLLTLGDAQRGRRELEARRLAVARSLARVSALLDAPRERERAAALRRDVEAYHAAGDTLVESASARRAPRALDDDGAARVRYHEDVNPLLRHAVAHAARIREDHFRSSQEVAAWARDQARQAVQILACVFGAALLLSLVVAFYLARVVLSPIGELSRAVEALRQGDFTRRLKAPRRDELGQLAEGFNRMADDLEAFRRANIGEVIAAKETLEATLAALPDAVVVIEPGGGVSSANPRAADVMRALHGAPAQHVGELPLPEGVRDAVAHALRGEVANVPLDLSRSLAVRIREEHRRLLPRIVTIERAETKQDGVRYGAVLLLSDVTDLVRLDEMRMELVAVASHELRTPLTTLRMTLLLLEERAARLDATDRELLATALLGVEQLATTVGEFLDLTRIEAGQLRLHREPVDVEALLRQAMAAIQAICDEASIPIRLAMSQDAPRRIWGDAARLTVVFSNVLRNAAKYTPPGGAISITVEPAGAADVSSCNAPSGNAPSGNAPSGNVSNGKAPSGDAPSGNVSSGNVSNGKAPSGNVSSGDAPSGDVSSGNAPSGDAPSGDAPSDGDGDAVRVTITDTGPGVPEEFRRRIFDKFFRVEHYRPDAESVVHGSGIGLYIAREIVEAHGGTIACHTGPNDRGARFAIVLPVPRGDEPPPSARAAFS
ncbi:ATP-binding protein [Pendulispora albinea]|uniref:histidine kinase n=1 Tax=Pendulispora albinea TaxID=2741071 RepID=A0ABZ2LNM0_9BACT